MLHPLQMEKPSEPLGTSFTLGELQDVVSFGVAAYGPETKICGYSGFTGIVIHAHFPLGLPVHVTLTEVTHTTSMS
jgi:hypothetical protein